VFPATGQAVVPVRGGAVSAAGIAAAVRDAGFEIGEVSTGNAQVVKLSINGVEDTGGPRRGALRRSDECCVPPWAYWMSLGRDPPQYRDTHSYSDSHLLLMSLGPGR